MISNIPEELILQSSDETFYEKYNQAKKTKETFSAFIQSLNKDEIVSKLLFVPEIKESIPDVLPEETFFGLSKKQTIVIRKHPRGTPVFYHSHEFLELFYVLKGHSDQVINGIDFNMAQGDICIIPPNVKHSLSVFDDSIILNILVRKTTFENIFHNFLCTKNIFSAFILDNLYSTKASDYLIFHTKPQSQVQNLILELYKENNLQDFYSQDVMPILLHRLFVEILRTSEADYELPPNVNKDSLLRFELIQYIQDSYKEASLDNLAENFKLTPQYASKLIRQLTGKTFSQILLNIRMQRACTLLQDTKIPIGDIAFEIGYANPEHFIRLFKREFSITPGEYRNQNKS